MVKPTKNNEKANKRRGLLRTLLFVAIILIFVVFVAGLGTVRSEERRVW